MNDKLNLFINFIIINQVAYSGPFTSNYRKILENSWVNRLDEIGIKHEDNITMFKFLGVPVVI